MKKIIFLLVIIVICSCKKDEPSTNSNYFYFQNIKHEIKTCSITITNFPTVEKAISIGFFDKDVQFSSSSSILNLNQLNGLSYVSFMSDVYNGEPLNGNYIIGEGFHYNDISIDYNLSLEDFNQSFSIKSGLLSILKMGNIYEIEFKCVTESNDSIIGYYNGKVYELESNQP